MPVVQVQLPDGRVVPVEVPDSPEAQQEATKSSLSGLKDAAMSGGKSIARGFLGGLAGLAEGAAAFNFADRMGRTPTPGREMTAGVEKMLPIPKEESTFEKLSRKGLEGVGGAFATPVPGAMAANAFAGGVGGVTGELGRSFGERAGPVGEVAGQVLGGALGGGLAGFMAGPKQSVAQADIRRELEGVPEADWQTASQNVDLFNQTGARTATLAEAFPGKTRIAALAGRAASSKGGERLGEQLKNRDSDLGELGETFLSRIGPEVDANRVANTSTAAANGIMKNAKQQRGQAIGETFAGQSVRDVDTLDIYTNLQSRAAMEKRPEARQAYELVATKLFDADGMLLTGVQDLSFALKGLKKATKNPNSPVFKGSDIENRDLINAISVADTMLRARSVPYKTGMENFEQITRQVIDPLRKSPIGSLSAKNPTLEGQAPFGRLGGILPNNSPTTIYNTVMDLGDNAKTLGNPQNPEELARALMQQKLAKGSTNPGQTVRGAAGSLADRQTDALLLAAGKDPDMVKAPLRAADQMQGINSAGVAQNMPEMRSAQAAIRPFRTLDMLMTARFERQTQAAIAEYLARPTQEGLAELKRIAMFDPTVRKKLTLLAALRPGVAANTQEQ